MDAFVQRPAILTPLINISGSLYCCFCYVYIFCIVLLYLLIPQNPSGRNSFRGCIREFLVQDTTQSFKFEPK